MQQAQQKRAAYKTKPVQSSSVHYGFFDVKMDTLGSDTDARASQKTNLNECLNRTKPSYYYSDYYYYYYYYHYCDLDNPATDLFCYPYCHCCDIVLLVALLRLFGGLGLGFLH